VAQLLYGDRIGKTAKLRIGCTAVVFDASGEQVLLTQRTDNGRWCLPGGGMDPGESAVEACVREVWEETGLAVEVERLLGVYSTPHRISVYADGNRWQNVGLVFVARIVGGALGLSHETLAAGFYPPAVAQTMDVFEHHLQYIQDALTMQPSAFLG
jgi:8-oxo-dGTP pyrophosphatase MutT (NUDIX family)